METPTPLERHNDVLKHKIDLCAARWARKITDIAEQIKEKHLDTRRETFPHKYPGNQNKAEEI